MRTLTVLSILFRILFLSFRAAGWDRLEHTAEPVTVRIREVWREGLEEFAWRSVVLAAVNAFVMWLAIKLFDSGNDRNSLAAAVLWSTLFSALVHLGLFFPWPYSRYPFSLFGFVVFYAALLKWYDLEIGEALKVAVVTLAADVGAYIALTKVGILPPFETASVFLRTFPA
jgi:hypothetical protein